MFTKVKNWVMEHPVMTGLILIAAVLSFFAFRKMFQGGGGDAIVSPQTIDPSITAAQISAGQQLQSQQIAAGVQQTGIEAQLMAQLDTNAVTEAVTLANLTSSENVALAGIGANQAVSLADIAATENTTIHNIDALVEIATFEPTPEPVALRLETEEEWVGRITRERPDVIGQYNANTELIQSGEWQGWDEDDRTTFGFATPADFTLYWARTFQERPRQQVPA